MTPSELLSLLSTGPGPHLAFLADRVGVRDFAYNLVAMANAEGGTIVFGAGDEGEIAGLKSPERAHELALRAFMLCSPPLMLPMPERVDLNGQNLLVVQIPKGLPHVYNVRGKYLIRDEKRNAPLGARRLRQLLLDRGDSGYESQLVGEATTDALDDRKMKSYLNAVEAFADANPLEVLLQRGCLRKDSGQLRPTVAGILMFGKDPTRYLRQCSMLLAQYTGEQMSDDFSKEEIRETLPEQIRRAENFVVAHMRKNSRLNGLERVERLEYPRAAIREVVVNAVAHRDYSIRGDEVRISMFADRIEAYSPGRLPGHVTIKNIIDERFSRNDVLVQLLGDLGYIERLGYGIDRMMRLMREHGLPRPHFSETANGFQVTLFGPGDKFKADEQEATRWQRLDLNERQSSALRWLQQNSRITNREYRELYPDVSEETIRRDLAELVDKDILLKIGDKRATYYILK
jgi:ATP-dependent DNA helicase RecG